MKNFFYFFAVPALLALGIGTVGGTQLAFAHENDGVDPVEAATTSVHCWVTYDCLAAPGCCCVDCCPVAGTCDGLGYDTCSPGNPSCSLGTQGCTPPDCP